MSAPERKYTDSDVRADPELTELAYDYLDVYTGDFEPLVQAQDRVASRQFLTTSQVRVVLNCMRHDWNIADNLPTPMAKVIDMPVRGEHSVHPAQGKKRKKGKPVLPEPCTRTDIHERHQLDQMGFYCHGVPNDREDYLWIDAKVKVKYVKAKGGKMIHLVGDGSNFQWKTNRFGPGFSRFSPYLNIKLLCKYPSWLRNPILLPEIPEGMLTPQGKPIGLCPYCEKERNDNSSHDA